VWSLGLAIVLCTYRTVLCALCMCCNMHVYSSCVSCVFVCVVVHCVYVHVVCNVLGLGRYGTI